MVSPPEAGPSRAPPQKPEKTTKGVDHGLGIVIPEKNCMWCIMWGSLCQWDVKFLRSPFDFQDSV